MPTSYSCSSFWRDVFWRKSSSSCGGPIFSQDAWAAPPYADRTFRVCSLGPPGKNPTTPRSGDGSLGRRCLMSGEILNERDIVNEPNEQQLKTLLGSFLDGEDGKITMTDAVQITSTVIRNKYKNFLQIIKT